MTGENIRHLPRLPMTGAMRIFGLTARALRYYEARGLVAARRDRRNARYYDAAATTRLRWIVRLRKAGVSLAEIATVLQAEDPTARRERALQSITRRRERASQELGWIEAVLAEIAAEQAPDDGARGRQGMRG